MRNHFRLEPFFRVVDLGQPIKRQHALLCEASFTRSTLLAASGVVPFHLTTVLRSQTPERNLQLIAHFQYRETSGSASFEGVFLKLYIQQTSRLIFSVQTHASFP